MNFWKIFSTGLSLHHLFPQAAVVAKIFDQLRVYGIGLYQTRLSLYPVTLTIQFCNEREHYICTLVKFPFQHTMDATVSEQPFRSWTFLTLKTSTHILATETSFDTDKHKILHAGILDFLAKQGLWEHTAFPYFVKNALGDRKLTWQFFRSFLLFNEIVQLFEC